MSLDKKEYLSKLHKTQVKILDEIKRVCDKNNLEYVLIGGTLLGAVRHKGFIPWDDDLDIAMPRKDYDMFLNIAEKELKEEFFLDYYKNNKKYLNVFAKVRLKNTLYEEKLIQGYETNKEIWVDIFPLDYSQTDLNKKIISQEKMVKRFKKIAKFSLQLEKDSKSKKIVKFLVSKFINNITAIKIAEKYMIKQNSDECKYFVNFGSQYGLKKQTHLKEKYFPAKELEFEGKMYKVPNDYDYVLNKIYGKNYMELPPIEKRITHNPIKIKFEDGQVIEFDKEN